MAHHYERAAVGVEGFSELFDTRDVEVVRWFVEDEVERAGRRAASVSRGHPETLAARKAFQPAGTRCLPAAACGQAGCE